MNVLQDEQDDDAAQSAGCRGDTVAEAAVCRWEDFGGDHEGEGVRA